MTQIKRKQIFLAIIDVALLYASLYFALLLRKWIPPTTRDWQVHIAVFKYIFIWWVMCYYTGGLYNFAVIFDRVILARRLLLSTIVATLGTIVLFYIYRAPGISPKTVLALFAISAFLSGYIIRKTFTRILSDIIRKRGIAFVGRINASVRELLNSSSNLARFGYEARMVLDAGPCEEELPQNLRCCKNADELTEAVRSGYINLIVISDDQHLSQEIRRLLFDLLDTGAGCMNLFNFYELIFRRIPLEDIDETWFLDNIDLSAKKPYIAIKRLIDIIVSLIFLAISSPLWPFIALLIKIESRGPIIFRQKRLGRLSKSFDILKFRTMRVENNHQQPTSQNDSRITMIGRWLRKSRLDEIPQLINVLIGDMSFVGPRPERPNLAKELECEIPYYRQRLLVKPGLTGWDQVSGEYHSPSKADTFKKLQADLYYVKNLSLSLDGSIFFKTILTVLKASGR